MPGGIPLDEADGVGRSIWINEFGLIMRIQALLPLDEAIIAVIVIVSARTDAKLFEPAKQPNSKMVRDRPYVSIRS